MGTPYSAFRNPGVPTAYGPNKTAVSPDVTLAGLTFAFLILVLSFLAILPGIRRKNRIYAAVRFIVGMFIGFTILLSTYGQDWEVSSLHNVTTAYKAFIKDEIQADIGVKIGLRNVNVTLKALPEYPEEGQLRGEHINYNERFTFCCNQGRRGFGTFAGRINREFRDAQWKGLPYPILWIVEYFTLDGEDIRWGRSYRVAGFYTFMVMWTAFCVWVLALALSFTVIRYTGFLLTLTGICMLSSNMIYALVRYGSDLVIPFGQDHVLEFSKGGSFYLCMVGGILSTVIGVAIVVLNDLYPFNTAVFFNVDPLQDYQDTFAPQQKLQTRPGESWTASGDAHQGNGASDAKAGKALERPLSQVNEDPRTEGLAAEAAKKRESEAYTGNIYVNFAEMSQSFVPSRPGLFQKHKPRRKTQPREDGRADDHDSVVDKGAGGTSSLLPHQRKSVRFSSNGMESETRADDTVAMDTFNGVQAIRMSEIGLDNEVDIEDENDETPT